MTKERLTAIGSVAAVVAIGSLALVNVAPVLAAVIVVIGTAIATASLYWKIVL